MTKAGDMAGKDVHYEVFVKKHKKASWTLVEAGDDREAAFNLAHRLKARHAKGSVRIQREQWIAEDSAFRGGVIFEAGPERFAEPKEKKGEASLPCLTPDDLSGSAARETVRRVLAPWLERRQVAPLELLHRADLIEALDASDTDLQHAVQKVAIARAQNSDASVHAYVRLINDLVEKGVAQSRRDAKAGKKSPKSSGFAELSEKILSEGAPEKRLRRAIAERLAEATGFSDKTALLLDLHDDLPRSAEAREFAGRETDNFLAEMLSFDSAVRSLLGKTGDLGEEVERLTAVYEGSAHGADLLDAPDTARRLAEKFADRALPTAHIEIAKRILSALRAPRRFRPDSVMAEIELARKLAQRLIVASGPNLHPDSLVDAFTHRSAKLLAPDAVEEALANAQDPADQIERLYRMEDNLVGEQNKRTLAAYVRSRLKSTQAESFFVRGGGSALERLARLTGLQERALNGSFGDQDKAELAEAFDQVGLMILDVSKVLTRLTSSGQPPLEQARALLKLAAGGVLPAGRCAQDAQARAMRILADDMARGAAGLPENRATVVEIQTLMAALKPDTAAKVGAA
jgi:hypothetical protein